MASLPPPIKNPEIKYTQVRSVYNNFSKYWDILTFSAIFLKMQEAKYGSKHVWLLFFKKILI